MYIVHLVQALNLFGQFFEPLYYWAQALQWVFVSVFPTGSNHWMTLYYSLNHQSYNLFLIALIPRLRNESDIFDYSVAPLFLYHRTQGLRKLCRFISSFYRLKPCKSILVWTIVILASISALSFRVLHLSLHPCMVTCGICTSIKSLCEQQIWWHPFASSGLYHEGMLWLEPPWPYLSSYWRSVVLLSMHSFILR